MFISLERSHFSRKSPFIFQARIVLKPLVSLLGRLVACSARISVDTQTERLKAWLAPRGPRPVAEIRRGSFLRGVLELRMR